MSTIKCAEISFQEHLHQDNIQRRRWSHAFPREVATALKSSVVNISMTTNGHIKRDSNSKMENYKIRNKQCERSKALMLLVLLK